MCECYYDSSHNLRNKTLFGGGGGGGGGDKISRGLFLRGIKPLEHTNMSIITYQIYDIRLNLCIMFVPAPLLIITHIYSTGTNVCELC